jgi:hypothetical protein
VEEYIVCVHIFCEPSLESLREAVGGSDLGRLRYAVKVAGPSYAEMQKILTQNWTAAFDGSRPIFQGFNIHPFVEMVEIDEGIFEYHASEVNFFSLDAAHKLWSNVEIVTARAEFDRWFRSADATLDKPVNRECAMLRRIVEETEIIVESITGSKATPREQLPSQPKRIGGAAFRKAADRVIAFDKVAQRIIDAALSNEKIPFFRPLCEELVRDGTWKGSVSTFQNQLTTNKPIQGLMKQARKRPANFASKAYRKWREEFEKYHPIFRRQLVQRDDTNLHDEDKSISAKKQAKKDALKYPSNVKKKDAARKGKSGE